MCIFILLSVFMILSMDVRVKCRFVCLYAVTQTLRNTAYKQT